MHKSRECPLGSCGCTRRFLMLNDKGLFGSPCRVLPPLSGWGLWQRELSSAALQERADGKYQPLQGRPGEDNEKSSIGKRGETEVGVPSTPGIWRSLRRMKSPSPRARYPLPPTKRLVLPGRKPCQKMA